MTMPAIIKSYGLEDKMTFSYTMRLATIHFKNYVILDVFPIDTFRTNDIDDLKNKILKWRRYYYSHVNKIEHEKYDYDELKRFSDKYIQTNNMENSKKLAELVLKNTKRW